MRKAVFVLTGLLLATAFCNQIHAQSGSFLLNYKSDLPTPQEVEQIKTRKLIIMSARWEADIVEEYKRLKEFAALEEYKDNCATYSKAYTDMIEGYWSLHDTAIVRSYIDIKTMLEAGEKDYVVLAFVQVHGRINNDDKKEFTYTYSYTGDEAANDARPYDPLNYKALVLLPIEALTEFPDDIRKMYLGVAMPHQVPVKSDIIYGIDIMNDIVKRKAANPKFSDNMLKEYAPKLKDYTLAISKDNWESSYLLREAEEWYKLPIEKVEPEKFAELVEFGMPGYAIAFKVGNFTAVILSDTREIAYIQTPMDIPTKKTSQYFNSRDFHKIYEAVTGERVTFKEK